VTSKGRKLYKAIIKFSNNLDYVSPGSPTYWPADPRKVPDVIDFVVTKIISRNLVRAKSLLHLSSDHSPVLIILLQSPKIIRHPYRLTSHRTNWLKYKKYVPTLIEPYSSTPIMTSITVPGLRTPGSSQYRKKRLCVATNTKLICKSNKLFGKNDFHDAHGNPEDRRIRRNFLTKPPTDSLKP